MTEFSLFLIIIDAENLKQCCSTTRESLVLFTSASAFYYFLYISKVQDIFNLKQFTKA